MARKAVLNRVFCKSLASTLAVMFITAEAEGKSKSSSSSSSGGTTIRCYNDKMVEISCPLKFTTTDIVATCIGGGAVGFLILYLLYDKVRGMIWQRREDRRRGEVQMVDLERGRGVGRHSQDSADASSLPSDSAHGSHTVYQASPPRYAEKAEGGSEEPEEPTHPLHPHHPTTLQNRV